MATMVDALRGFGRVKLGAMAFVAVALIGTFTFIALRISSPALTPLYTNLSADDAAKIVAELGKLGVPYDTMDNGAQITVPADRALRLRMTLAEMGLPSNGSVVGYEIFDKTDSFGSSNFVMNVNMRRALEGELARTISAFNPVESARVHLVIPKRELFSKTQAEPSASVALKLRGNMELSKGEIASITHFVAAAVPNLNAAKVTVVDSFGRLLARGDGQQSVGAVAAAAEEYRLAYETRTQETLEHLLQKIVGPGNVQVKVAAEMDFDRIITDSEIYDPEGQVARSVQSNTVTETSSEDDGGGNVSVGSQLPDAAAGSGAGGESASQMERTDEITNFEISKTIRKHIKEGGTLKRLSLAVLVDGIYTGEENPAYQPRSEEEMARIESLVKSAVMFDEERGDSIEVVNMQFTELQNYEEEESFLGSFRHEMEGILHTLIIAGVAILAILVVLRPAIQALMKMSAASAAAIAADGEGMPMLNAPPGSVITRSSGGPSGPMAAGGGATTIEEEDDMIDLANIKGGVRSSSVRKVIDFVDKNPDESMSVVRQWMLKEQA